MARREKFGKLVLLEELGTRHLGVAHRAARVGPNGLDRIVTVWRYSEELSTHPDAPTRLMDQTRLLSRLQPQGFLRVLGIGRVGPSYYMSYELVEGHTLSEVIERCRRESFPFAGENALMVASRVASALGSLHRKKDDAGRSLFHGLLLPSHVFVTYEGDVRLTGFGVWPSLRDTGLLGSDERRYLAPEQTAGEPGDVRSDIYTLALLILETLTLRPPYGTDPLAGLPAARLVGAAGEEEPLPTSLKELLRRALASDPDARYRDLEEMRKALDGLLFSGDFAPTTFNLAFFMQTLFRDDMEREVRALEEARAADYTEFLPTPTPSRPPAGPVPPPQGPAPSTSLASSSAASEPAPPPSPAPARASVTGHGPSADGSGATRALRTRAGRAAATHSAARLTLSRPPEPRGRRGLLLLVGLLVAVMLGGGGGYLYFLRQPPPVRATPVTTLSPEAAAALARVRELEERIAELEREKLEAEELRLEAEESPSPSPAASPPSAAAIEAERARAEARRRARAERARREAEIRRLEAEMKAAEEQLVAQQRPATQAPTADLASALPPVLAPPPTPEPVPSPNALPAVSPGMLVDADDPRLTPPEFLSEEPVVYPPAALLLRREATVLTRALVDETGKVAEVEILESSSSNVGFDEAAVRQVRSRRYRPGAVAGVPVKVWVRVRVIFQRPGG